MKVVIKETCVVAQGRIANRGDIYDTGDVDPASDRLAYDLISNNRALAMNLYSERNGVKTVSGDNPEALEFLRLFKAEQAKLEQPAGKGK